MVFKTQPKNLCERSSTEPQKTLHGKILLSRQVFIVSPSAHGLGIPTTPTTASPAGLWLVNKHHSRQLRKLARFPKILPREPKTPKQQTYKTFSQTSVISIPARPVFSIPLRSQR